MIAHEEAMNTIFMIDVYILIKVVNKSKYRVRKTRA